MTATLHSPTCAIFDVPGDKLPMCSCGINTTVVDPRPGAVTHLPDGVLPAAPSQAPFSAATMAGYSRPQVVTGVLGRFPRAMRELAKISALGCQKHKVKQGDMGYLDVPDAYQFYTDKVGRHIVDEAIEGPMQSDPDMPGCSHAGAAAWNALARLESFLRDKDS